MVRRIAFDDDEASGAVRRRGQRWREERVAEAHGHAPMTPEARTRRMIERNDKRKRVAPAGRERTGFGRFLRNPIVLILGFLLFNVLFIAFLIIRAVWLASLGRRTGVDV